MYRKYYSFYLRNIFLQPSVNIDDFARNMRTHKIIIIPAINELMGRKYITIENDCLNLTPKGVNYLVNKNLISADKHGGIEERLPFIGISKNELFKILGWIIAIICLAIVVGLFFSGKLRFLIPFLKLRIY